MKSKIASIFICIVMVTSISVTIIQNLGQLSMNASGAGSLADSPWPMFRGNVNHTGLSPYDTSRNLGNEKWNFTALGILYSSPAIGPEGTIYVGSMAHKLYAVNPDGTHKWNFTVGESVQSSPAIDSNGTIYFGSADHKFYAVNSVGTQKWNFTTGDRVMSSPVIAPDGTIYFISMDSKVYALNPDGTKKWNYATESVAESSPAIGSDGTIYVGSDDHKLYALNPNGTLKWNFTTEDIVESSPTIGTDGTIYIGSDDNKLYAINPDGTQKWNFTTGDDINACPGIGSDGTIYIGSGDHKFYAINPNGTQKWSFITGGIIYSSSAAIGAEGTIYFGSYDRKLYALNPDGTEKWSFLTDLNVYSSPAIDSDGTIYFGSADGKLYAIGNPSLEVEVTSHFSTLNSAAQSAITVYVTNGTNPVQGATVNLETDNGGIFSPQSGLTDINGNFTSIFNAPTVITQIICRINAEANKTEYNNGSGYVDITIKPIPWPMFRHNCRRTSLSPYDTSSNPGKLKWSFTTGALVYSPPSIGSDGKIYVGSYDNKLYAINPDGTEKWNFMTGDSIGSSPAIGSDGTIYVGSYDNKLYAIRPNGTEKWNFETSHDVRSSPTISFDGTIYVGSQDHNVYAINPDGTEKWNFTTGESVNSSPAIASDGTIYIGSLDSKLYAINPDGTEKWNFTTGDRVWSSPAIGTNETIYVGSYDNKLYAIDQYGTEIWSFITNGDVFSSPGISSDGTIYVGSNDGKLYAINPDGTQKWNFTTGSWVLSSLAIGSDKTIYVGSGDNNLYAINPDGTEKWRYTTEDGIISSPGIGSDGTIYVGSYDGKLYAIGMAITPPTLYIIVSQDGEDVILYWDPPSTPGIDHYLIYRSASQTNFDFNTIWVNTLKDYESGELGPIPLRTMWNDTKAALPGNTNYNEQYYYVIRAVSDYGEVSTTSRTVGKWTKAFPGGVSTFSLPLEPIDILYTDNLIASMNADYIKYIDPINHTWRWHNFGDGTINNTEMKLGEGYEVKFDNQTNYTFTGMPGAMIIYDDDTGFFGFDPGSEAKNLTATVDPLTGNVTLNWTKPSSVGVKDQYYVLRSTARDGFWSGNYIQLANLSFNVLSYTDISNATGGTQYYYMIVPVNETSVEGTSTYTIGIWTEEYLAQYDTIGIPLKLESYQTADWYCDNIPGTVGINFFNINAQRWSWHSTRMPQGAYDPILEMTEGYQISTSVATKYTFIGH